MGNTLDVSDMQQKAWTPLSGRQRTSCLIHWLIRIAAFFIPHVKGGRINIVLSLAIGHILQTRSHNSLVFPSGRNLSLLFGVDLINELDLEVFLTDPCVLLTAPINMEKEKRGQILQLTYVVIYHDMKADNNQNILSHLIAIIQLFIIKSFHIYINILPWILAHPAKIS